MRSTFPNIRSKEFLETFFLSAFFVDMHNEFGDKNVDCSDWIAQQRILFYAKKDEESGEETRCIETQRYEQFDDVFKVYIQVNPENPLGSSIFKIEVVVTGKTENETTTDLEISIVVECKKRLWGGYGNTLVESILEKNAKTQYEKFLARCKQEVEKRSERKDSVVGIDASTTATATIQQKQSSLFNRHQLRHKGKNNVCSVLFF